jgi:hypothetical protein
MNVPDNSMRRGSNITAMDRHCRKVFVKNCTTERERERERERDRQTGQNFPLNEHISLLHRTM